MDAQVALQSKITNVRKSIQIVAERELKDVSESLHTEHKDLREKTHSSMLVVTIREGEERGICSAAMKALLRMVKYQIEERSVVVVELNKRVSNLETLSRPAQLKYIDVEEMRVVTNNRCAAEHFMSDSVESVVMGGPKIGEFVKVGRE